MSNHRTELARSLAEIDQLLAEAEDIVEDPQDDDRDGALNLLIEFQEWRRSVEAEMRAES